MTIKEVLQEAESKMKKSHEALRHTLAAIRTGRASPALVEHLQVEYYGAEMPLNQLANIAAPEPRMITIQPYDQGAIKAIRAMDHATVVLHSSIGGRRFASRMVLPLMADPSCRSALKRAALGRSGAPRRPCRSAAGRRRHRPRWPMSRRGRRPALRAWTCSCPGRLRPP